MKYRVNVGGYVSVYRERTYTVSASSAEEAIEKVENRWAKDQQHDGNMCGSIKVKSICEVKK